MSGEAKQSRVFINTHFKTPYQTPAMSVNTDFQKVNPKLSVQKTERVEKRSPKKTDANVPTQVNNGEVKKKKKVFNNANKVVYSFMSTSENRKLLRTAPERSNHYTKNNTKHVEYWTKKEVYQPQKKMETESDLQKQIQTLKEKLQRKEMFLDLEEQRKRSAQRDLDLYIPVLAQLEREFQVEHERGQLLEKEICKHKQVIGDFQSHEVEFTKEDQPTPSKLKKGQKIQCLNELDDFGEVEDLKNLNSQLDEFVISNLDLKTKLKLQETETTRLQEKVTELTKQLKGFSCE